MKFCKRCEIEKVESAFYSKDSTCKECRKAIVKANRVMNLDYYREYDRKRGDEPHRVAARATYAGTKTGKLAADAAKRRWEQINAEAKGAATAIGNAIRGGKLQKEPCFICGNPEAEAHHSAYDLPLHVTWLCDTHHKQVHREHRQCMRDAGIFKPYQPRK